MLSLKGDPTGKEGEGEERREREREREGEEREGEGEEEKTNTKPHVNNLLETTHQTYTTPSVQESI